jgi:uncharacterized Zn finger protein (UPF0148 family)
MEKKIYCEKCGMRCFVNINGDLYCPICSKIQNKKLDNKENEK